MAHWTPGVTNALIQCTFLLTPGPCPSPSGSLTHRRSAAHHGQLCPQQATRTPAWATSTGHPHQTLSKCPQAMVTRAIPKTSGVTVAIPAAGHPEPPLETSDSPSHPTKPWPSPPIPAQQGMGQHLPPAPAPAPSKLLCSLLPSSTPSNSPGCVRDTNRGPGRLQAYSDHHKQERSQQLLK